MPPDDYRLGGLRPIRLMLGTGTGAVVMWPPRYTATGTFIPDSHQPAASVWQTTVTHTVETFGASLITGSVGWYAPDSGQIQQVRLLVNGVVVATNPNSGPNPRQVSTSGDRLVDPGDVVDLQIFSSAAGGSARLTNARTLTLA